MFKLCPRSFAAFLLFLLAGLAFPLSTAAQETAGGTEGKVLYTPPPDAPNTGANYPRVIQIQHYEPERGNLLATFSRRGPSFLIYRSTDGGDSWNLHSEIVDTGKGWGLNYQPQLFELPQQVGEFPPGTILAAGLSFPEDRSATAIQLYYSADGGKSWEYLSTIVEGGPPQTRTANPVWEPFLWLDERGRLVVYYADERHKDQGYNQLLAHKVSEDGGRTWSDEVYDVAIPGGELRPGMPVVTKLPDGTHLYVYEVVGLPGNPIHFKTSRDGLDFGDPADVGTMIRDAEGNFISGTPYVVWSPYGGPNGTLIASGIGLVIDGETVGNGVMINRDLGRGPWTILETPIHYRRTGQGGYSQTMLPLGNGREILHLIPVPNGRGEHNDIRYTKFSLPD